jgi:hypothetical protein
MAEKRANPRSKCPVTSGAIDLSRYEKVDREWRVLGLAAPARRALVDADLLKLGDLVRMSKADLAELHGMGPQAMSILKRELKRQGIHLRKKR